MANNNQRLKNALRMCDEEIARLYDHSASRDLNGEHTILDDFVEKARAIIHPRCPDCRVLLEKHPQTDNGVLMPCDMNGVGQ